MTNPYAPHSAVTITGGGSAIPGTRRSLSDAYDMAVEPEPVDWDTRVAQYAEALGIDDEVRLEFATTLDETVETFAGAAQVDLDLARTRVVAALAGTTGMVTELVPVDMSDELIEAALAAWEISEPDDGDLAIARLAVLRSGLEQLPADDAEDDSEASSGSDQSEDDESSDAAEPGDDEQPTDTPAPSPAPKVAYTADDVPKNAADVVAWISDAHNSDDSVARATVAAEVEEGRPEPRTTVQAAIDAVLGDGG